MRFFLNIVVFSIFLGFTQGMTFAYLPSPKEPALELVVLSHLGAGFFAELSKVVDNILYFESENLQEIKINWSQEFFPYKDDPFSNGWDLYFEPIPIAFSLFDGQSTKKVISGSYYHELHDHLCVDHWIRYEDALSYRKNANRIINKYIKVKPHILNKLSNFFENHMKGFYCIGVHIRYGADHGAEAPVGVPTLDTYIDEIKEKLDSYDNDKVKIYLATDSNYVVNLFKEKFADKLLNISAFRAEYRDEPHLIYGKADYWQAHKEEWHQKKPGYYGGETVLLDCLILSKCDVYNGSQKIDRYQSYVLC